MRFWLFPRQEKDWGYALQLADDDFSLAVETTTGNRDCLAHKKGELTLDTCAQETAWSCRVSAEGILFYGGKKLHPAKCLWRNVSSPILSSCEDDKEDSSHHLVRFSMVRYHTSAASNPVEQHDWINDARRNDNERNRKCRYHPLQLKSPIT
jgi:hypothetical protein